MASASSSSSSSERRTGWPAKVKAGFVVFAMFATLAAGGSGPPTVRLQGLSSPSAENIATARATEAIERLEADDPARIDALLRRSEALRAQGLLNEAAADAEAAVAAALTLGDDGRLARARGAAGAIAIAFGRLQPARQALAESLEAARRGGDAGTEAEALLDLGNAWAEDDRGKAAEAYARAAALADAEGLLDLSARAYLNLARLDLWTVRNYPSSAEHLRRAEGKISSLPMERQRAARLVARGVLDRDLERAQPSLRPRKAADAFREASVIAGQVGDARLASEAAGEWAELEMLEHRNEQAILRAREALRLARAAEAPDLAYRWQRQIGRLYAARGDDEAAVAAYRGAVETLRPLRTEIAVSSAAGGQEFRDALVATYLEYAALLFRQAGSAGSRSSIQTFLAEARNAIEQLKSAELENYFQNECVSELHANVARPGGGSAAAAVIYPIILPDQLVLLLEIGGRYHHFATRVDERSLRRQVERFRLAATAPGGGDDDVSRELYRLLFQPMDAVLRENDVETLVIVPDGPLRLISWAALRHRSTYLGERFALAVAPGFTLINPQPLSGVRPLVAALTEGRGSWGKLRFVDQEVGEVERRFDATVLKDRSFVRNQFEASLAATPFSIVHIASHARFGRTAADSYIVAYDGELDMNALERAMSPTRFREDPVELIILSACETAAGDEQAALGLAGIAVKAGARSALASLWRADDRAAYLLVTHFYSALAAGSSKAQALRSAQEHVRSTPGMEHPYYWAPFVVIGNWM